jgi:NADH dehydrogenase
MHWPLRRRLLLAFEQRRSCQQQGRTPQPELRFAVVGGGPTGVELAGTLAEIARHTLRQEFRRSSTRGSASRAPDRSRARRCCRAFRPSLAARAQGQQLESPGCRRSVTGTAGGRRSTNQRLPVSARLRVVPCRTVLWAAGVAASPLGRELLQSVPLLDRAGRVQVNPDLSAARPPGGVRRRRSGQPCRRPDGRPVPGVAPAAKQMGTHCGARSAVRTFGWRQRQAL